MNLNSSGRRSPELSLLDVAGKLTIDWYVVYHSRQQDNWWSRRLKAGFQHCWLVKSVQYGPQPSDILWVHVDPSLPFISVEVDFYPEPPWVRDHSMTVQRVIGAHRPTVREWFSIGPPSCVEIAKACLGISAFFVRTPWQLYQHIQKRGGVIVSR